MRFNYSIESRRCLRPILSNSSSKLPNSKIHGKSWVFFACKIQKLYPNRFIRLRQNSGHVPVLYPSAGAEFPLTTHENPCYPIKYHNDKNHGKAITRQVGETKQVYYQESNHIACPQQPLLITLTGETGYGYGMEMNGTVSINIYQQS